MEPLGNLVVKHHNNRRYSDASGSESDDPYVVDVDHVLDALREKVLTHKPDDVFSFLSQSVNELAEDNNLEKCERIHWKVQPSLLERALTIVILGASGDLAKKKTFPALFELYCDGLLPPEVNIIGYARSKIDDVESWKHNTLFKYFGHVKERGCNLEAFLKRITYMSGQYNSDKDFQRLNTYIIELENAYHANGHRTIVVKNGNISVSQMSTSTSTSTSTSHDNVKANEGGNRLFYLALPPSAFVDAVRSIRRNAMPENEKGWIRVVIEKPFGRDTESSQKLSDDIAPYFDENAVYRIDHYLGKEMVQNLITTRFANRIFSSIWNNNNVACVQITFKETIGTEGRGGYFDSNGIIRDVMQNHLTQILALVGMEKPRSLDAEDIRDEKVALLKCISPVKKEECVLGQYTASVDGHTPGYLDDPTVRKNSKCPTFAILRLNINNDRWSGVPFLLKAGKALEQRYVGIRIQFKDEIRPYGDHTQRNELVIRAQPSEAMYMKITTKTPGLMQGLRHTHATELDLTYRHRYAIRLPDAYESLINDVINGNSTNFVRKDELDAAWRIYTPLLHQIDNGELQPIPYPAGTRGPKEADEFLTNNGFKFQPGYIWTPTANKLEDLLKKEREITKAIELKSNLEKKDEEPCYDHNKKEKPEQYANVSAPIEQEHNEQLEE